MSAILFRPDCAEFTWVVEWSWPFPSDHTHHHVSCEELFFSWCDCCHLWWDRRGGSRKSWPRGMWQKPPSDDKGVNVDAVSIKIEIHSSEHSTSGYPCCVRFKCKWGQLYCCAPVAPSLRSGSPVYSISHKSYAWCIVFVFAAFFVLFWLYHKNPFKNSFQSSPLGLPLWPTNFTIGPVQVM